MTQLIKNPKVGVKYNVVPQKGDAFYRDSFIERENANGFKFISNSGCVYFESIGGSQFGCMQSVKIYKFSKNFKMPE